MRKEEPTMKLVRNLNLLKFGTSCLLIVILLPTLILSIGCGSNKVIMTSEIPSDFTTYQSNSHLFSISYPKDWDSNLLLKENDVTTAENNVINAINSGTPINNRQDLLYVKNSSIPSPSINVFVISVPVTEWKYEKVVEAYINNIHYYDNTSNYSLISQVKTVIGGRSATILDLVITQNSQFRMDTTETNIGPGPVAVHCLRLLVPIAKTVWVVDCRTTPDYFEQWQKDFNIMLKSLRVYE
jgi:hypothetical protein